MATDFDQRFVRREGSAFKALGEGSLCQSCGARATCSAIGTITRSQTCGDFVPVLGFPDRMGLHRSCNTFRRGLGVFRRLNPGQSVAFYSKQTTGLIGLGRVVRTLSGSLGSLLIEHAQHNHLMLEEQATQAPKLLFKRLQTIYGKNYAALDEVFSVIYIEPRES